MVQKADGVPGFIKKYETALGRKRKVTDTTLKEAQPFVSKTAWKGYFGGSKPNFSTDQREVIHLICIAFVDAEAWDTSKEKKFAVKLGQDPWRLPLIIQIGEEKDYHIYKPRSDFLMSKFSPSRMAVEVHSDPPHRPAVVFYRPVLQRASIVRLANTFNVYKNKKDFMFVAIYNKNHRKCR
ncbi:hypothetical protein H4582DRAFT_2059493 [Lactarius indigo]|nr:hypothetical protein H4582DRAFT_2059493 [Lactarius indigo]